MVVSPVETVEMIMIMVGDDDALELTNLDVATTVRVTASTGSYFSRTSAGSMDLLNAVNS